MYRDARKLGEAAGHPKPARPGYRLEEAKSRDRLDQRRLILWLAVPLMLLALCGAGTLLQQVAPGVISSDGG